jgi:diguanylate cyclase (GGDEF)-like protein/PAS domain S-box-containing protein
MSSAVPLRPAGLREFRVQAGWAAGLTLVFAVGTTLPGILFFSDPGQYALLHLVLEFTSMAISLMIVFLAWNLRDLEINSQVIIIGFFSLGVLLVDLAHTLSFPGMPALVTESSTQKGITFWLVGRAIAAAGFLVLALVPSRHWSPRIWLPGLALITATCAGVWWVGLYHPEAFPVFFVPGDGLTTIKRLSEYLLSATYAAAALLLFLQARRERSRDLAWLAAAAWTLMLAELYFTLYVTASDLFNLLSHVLKVAAYLMVYRAIFAAGVQDPHRRLAMETSLMRSLIDSVPDLVSYTDREGLLLGANRAFAARLRMEPADLVVRSPVDVAWSKERERERQHLPRISDSVERFEEVLHDESGHLRYFDTLQTPYFTEQGERLGVIEVSRDMTAQKVADERIHQLALYDQLTGLPNRALLGEQASREFVDRARDGQVHALVFLDLDDFKTINDTVGHRVGDLIIRETAQRLADFAGEGIKVARLGGDEFAVLVTNASQEDAATLAESLIQSLDRPFRIEQYELTLTASAGVALFPEDGQDFNALAARADAAMYRAKKEGRHTFRFYSGDMLLSSTERLELLAALRHAVDNDELVVHYQPQWSLRDSSIVGVEALVRWQHPGLGLLQPQAFIGLAEESGLILAIGEAVLHTALTDAAGWERQDGRHLGVAVNLSAVQFLQTDLTSMIRRHLLQTGFPADRLELEITESAAMASPENAEAVIDRLHALGTKVSIDDFGTGYSSMSYLRRFRIDRLKIDQSFVADLGRRGDDEAIVEAIIQLAKAMHCETVAEGVETQEQFDFLRERGCDIAQGFLLSRPVPAEEIGRLLQPVRETT